MTQKKDAITKKARGADTERPVGMSKPKGNRDEARYPSIPESDKTADGQKAHAQNIGKTHSSALRKTELNRP